MVRKERMRYWKITAKETDDFDYDESKLLNWEIKCIREPEEEAHFIGVFMYRNGTAYDYESVKGIYYFYNNIDRNEPFKIILSPFSISLPLYFPCKNLVISGSSFLSILL